MGSLPAVFRGPAGANRSTSTRSVAGSRSVSGNFLPVMLGLWPCWRCPGRWPARRHEGSLDLLASTPVSRRSIALQKLAGHVTAVAFAMLDHRALHVARESGLRRPAGRPVRPRPRRSGSRCSTGLLMLACGGAAFAAAPFVGRTRALAIGLIVLFGGYVIASYGSLSSLIDALGPAVLVRLDRRPPAARGRHRLAVGRAAGRRDRRPVRDRRRRLRAARHRWQRGPGLAATAVPAGGRARPVRPPAGRPARRRDRLGRRRRHLRRAHRRIGEAVRRGDPRAAADPGLPQHPVSGHRPPPAVRAAPARLLQLRHAHRRAGRGRRSPAGPPTKARTASSSCSRRPCRVPAGSSAADSA